MTAQQPHINLAERARRAMAALGAWRRRYNILRVTKDGGPESTVWAHWLFEWKRWGSVVLLRFEDGSRDAYHSHAFDCVSWVLWGGGLVEHRIGGPGANLEEPYLHVPFGGGLVPVVTRRAHLHKVISCGRTWVLSFRGPWAKTWREELPGGRQETLTHGRRGAVGQGQCPDRESGGVQCELAAGHAGHHACPEAVADFRRRTVARWSD